MQSIGRWPAGKVAPWGLQRQFCSGTAGPARRLPLHNPECSERRHNSSPPCEQAHARTRGQRAAAQPLRFSGIDPARSVAGRAARASQRRERRRNRWPGSARRARVPAASAEPCEQAHAHARRPSAATDDAIALGDRPARSVAGRAARARPSAASGSAIAGRERPGAVGYPLRLSRPCEQAHQRSERRCGRSPVALQARAQAQRAAPRQRAAPKRSERRNRWPGSARCGRVPAASVEAMRTGSPAQRATARSVAGRAARASPSAPGGGATSGSRSMEIAIRFHRCGASSSWHEERETMGTQARDGNSLLAQASVIIAGARDG